jgi:AcrR family transcriptional regulator
VQRLAINAAVNLGDQPRPERFADHLCDLLLRGLVPDGPSDEELDTSAAMSAAREAVRSWPRPHVVTGTGSRADIVAAARAEFARRGYEATTIRDIAAAAGIWMGTLYRRVSSKEELLGEILGEYSDSMGGAVRSVLSTGTSVPASLDALAYVFVNGKRRFRLESEIVKFEWRAGRTPSHPVPEFVRDSQAHAALLGRVLKKGMAEGTLRRIAPAAELDAHVRHAIWLPFEDHARTGVARAHRFLRSSLLRGFA